MNTTIANLSFKPKTEGDSLSDAAMREFIRRLEIEVQEDRDSDIWSERTEPADRTLVWWPKDSNTGSRIGQPLTFSATSSTWVPLGTELGVPAKRERRNGIKAIPSGANTVNIDFDPFGTSDYTISLCFVTYNAGAWGPAPTSANNFAWFVVNRTDGQFSVYFVGVPAGISVEWEIVENNPNKY